MSEEKPKKTYRSPYKRDTPRRGPTGKQLRLLVWVAELGMLTVKQGALLTGSTDRAVQPHMRNLFDLGFIEPIFVNRTTFTDADTPMTPDLLFGRAPTVFKVSPEGVKFLTQSGQMEKDDIVLVSGYGPKKEYYLAHEVEIRDVRVWLEQVKRAHNHKGVTSFLVDRKAHIGCVEPDAIFYYATHDVIEVFLLEVDRGTEKSPKRWNKKVEEYAQLFNSGALEEAGIINYRVIVTTPNVKRREKLWTVITTHLPYALTKPDMFWITEKSTLESVDVFQPVWRVGMRAELMPLL